MAQGGTLFLDGIDQLPTWAQAKLANEFERDGNPADSDARLIATALPGIDTAAHTGRFSEHLYFCLNVAPISVPSLRHRPEDISPLAEFFLQRTAQRLGKCGESIPSGFSDEACALLAQYDWPGNVRELAHVVERAVVSNGSGQISAEVVDRLIDTNRKLSHGIETISVPLRGNLREIERNIICQVIERHFGNKAAAARSLGMHRRTIYRLLETTDDDATVDAFDEDDCGTTGLAARDA